ncbi:MAG TPA: hypothetical protein VMZ28_06945 [Kofleriaceae bacterium]|nr:hypothetical protein [Kofleriaceae bacterium]
MKPIAAPPPTRLEPAPRARETLVSLVSDLMRRSWLRVDARHYLDDYEASQWLPPTPLRELQLAKLRRLVWHCFLNVPWYTARIGKTLQPSEIERLEGLSQLPAPRAEERQDERAFVSTTKEAIADERMTAGRRGPALRVFIDADALERRMAVRLRVERWAGAPPGKIVAIWGREALRPERPLDLAEVMALRTAMQRVRPAVVTGPGPALAALAESLDPEIARAQPGLKALLGRFNLPGGVHALEVSGVIARGEDPDNGGSVLAEKCGARLSRWYAAAEVGVIAATCDRVPSPVAMHVQADHLLVEILGEKGEVLPPGAVGRIHVTDLHNYAAPYLRHDLADVGRLLPHPCPCGRALPLLEWKGRAT